MTNPLDAFVNRTSIDANDVRLAKFPKLQALVKQHGLVAGLAQFDEEVVRLRQNDERVINERIAAIKTQQTATADNGSSAVTVVVNNVPQGPVATPTDDLAFHIAQNIVHGTTSPVVGETDEQALEKKTIGLSFPRDGRFAGLMSTNLITSSQTITIKANTNWVTTGPITISGTLVVEGYFANVADVPPPAVSGEVYGYAIDPTSESIIPDDPTQPALVYQESGVGPTYFWNVTTQQWV